MNEQNTNSLAESALEDFINSDYVVKGENMYCREIAFMKAFNKYCRENKISPPKWIKSYYSDTFKQNGLTLEFRTLRYPINEKGVLHNSSFIIGIDVIDF